MYIIQLKSPHSPHDKYTCALNKTHSSQRCALKSLQLIEIRSSVYVPHSTGRRLKGTYPYTSHRSSNDSIYTGVWYNNSQQNWILQTTSGKWGILVFGEIIALWTPKKFGFTTKRLPDPHRRNHDINNDVSRDCRRHVVYTSYLVFAEYSPNLNDQTCSKIVHVRV